MIALNQVAWTDLDLREWAQAILLAIRCLQGETVTTFARWQLRQSIERQIDLWLETQRNVRQSETRLHRIIGMRA